MSPVRRPSPGSTADWLRLAGGDMAVARLRRSSAIPLELLCFHAQQAAEKAVKAVLTHRRIAFPRTHNIGALVSLLPTEIPLTFDPVIAATLSDYAVLARYPGEYEPVGRKEYLVAVDAAADVLKWARRVVRRANADAHIVQHCRRRLRADQ